MKSSAARPPSEWVRGSASNVPFWPGGLEWNPSETMSYFIQIEELLKEFCLKKSSCPDVSTLVQSLQQALALEAKFQPKLQLLSTASNTGESGEIKCSMRDGAAHFFWIDALNMMDWFMSRMKARPKHLSCIAISSFHLAACQWVERVKPNNNEASSIQSPLQVVPEPQYLVTISQCKCTAGDINRMEKIVEAKLACHPKKNRSRT
ncbi:hypothetical protein DAPPUDRAFT_256312 [Daphnia pulex]|uniref:Ski2 N-terminal domain-containing protein n=1 Tax=Daphnia pulex TaxID=6669 RepID=E9HB33_DAPPU|nr:hypothetical protein DAPPUDRAFT_256312 [Daphnia pulex]|eukprot:EFX71038.1 hypothetical protein DAPPUDRAFT_256312 [Daphnia pulex]